MKNTRKLLVALLLVFTLLMSMATIFASAADEGTVVYLKPLGKSFGGWNEGNERYAVYYFGNGDGWAGMSDPDGDGVYEATIPAGYTSIIFCRMNGTSTTNSWTYKWNQTIDLKLSDSIGKCYEISSTSGNSEGKCTGKWVSYAPPAHSHTYERSEESVDATCHAGGKLVEVCSDPECGAKRETELKAGHAYVEGVCSACGFDINEAHTVYFNKPESWAEVAVHYWGDKGDGTTWPGTLITPVEGVYSIEIPAGYDHIIFNNNNKQSQTDDLTIPAEPQVYNLDTKAWSDYHTHSWSDATCTKPKTCECGATDGEALGHNMVTDAAVPPTCLATGLTEGSHCSRCDHKVAQDEVPALGHSFANGMCSVCYAPQPNAPLGLVLGDNSFVVSASHKAVGFEFVLLAVAERGTYTITAEGGIFAWIFTDAIGAEGTDFGVDAETGALTGSSWTKYGVNTAVLDPGYYYVGVYYYTVAEAGTYNFNVAKSCAHTGGTATCLAQAVCTLCEQPYGEKLDHVYGEDGKCTTEGCTAEKPEEAPHVNTLVVGETNKIVVDGDTFNDYNLPIEWVAFVADEKAHYEFVGNNNALVFIFDGDLNILCGGTGKADLEAGTYLICIGNGAVGEINVAVTKSEISDEPVETPELPQLVIGENTVTIDGTVTNLTGNAIAWYELVVTEAGKYAIVSDELNGYIYSEMNLGSLEACLCGFTGVAELQPGTYYVCVGKEGKTGTFTVKVQTGEVETAAVNTVVLGENKYVLNGLRFALGYEFTTFVADKAGYYTFTGADPVTIFIWPDYPNVAVTEIPTTAPYVWNVKADNSGFNESFTVYLEAGEYAIGFRYDFAEIGEYDYTITYSETDPNAAPEAPELNAFERVIAAITAFFAKIVVWFQNLVAGFKK